MKEFIVFSRKIAVQLRERGFKITRVDVNRRKPEFDVWVFEDTPEFRVAFDEITHKS